MLFTHRGLSGPAILQISSYWREGDEISISMLPGADVFEALREARPSKWQAGASDRACDAPAEAAGAACRGAVGLSGNLADMSDKQLRRVETSINGWRVKPAGSEGYRTAEVTLGGVDTRGLDSRTMAVESRFRASTSSARWST